MNQTAAPQRASRTATRGAWSFWEFKALVDPAVRRSAHAVLLALAGHFA